MSLIRKRAIVKKAQRLHQCYFQKYQRPQNKLLAVVKINAGSNLLLLKFQLEQLCVCPCNFEFYVEFAHRIGDFLYIKSHR